MITRGRAEQLSNNFWVISGHSCGCGVTSSVADIVDRAEMSKTRKNMIKVKKKVLQAGSLGSSKTDMSRGEQKQEQEQGKVYILQCTQINSNWYLDFGLREAL